MNVKYFNTVPFLKAKKAYLKQTSEIEFYKDLSAHSSLGQIYYSDEYFLIGKKIKKGSKIADVMNPFFEFPNPDCWMVYLYAGNIRIPFELADEKFPWVCFERRGKLKYYKYETIFLKSSRFFASSSVSRMK